MGRLEIVSVGAGESDIVLTKLKSQDQGLLCYCCKQACL